MYVHVHACLHIRDKIKSTSSGVHVHVGVCVHVHVYLLCNLSVIYQVPMNIHIQVHQSHICTCTHFHFLIHLPLFCSVCIKLSMVYCPLNHRTKPQSVLPRYKYMYHSLQYLPLQVYYVTVQIACMVIYKPQQLTQIPQISNYLWIGQFNYITQYTHA